MHIRKWLNGLFGIITLCSTSFVYANIEVPIYLVAEQGQGQSIGTVTLQDGFNGVLITPHLKDLPPGVHGFHIHLHPNCGDKGMAAGGHFDPAETKVHEGPYNKGHLGDLPVLIVDKDGTATLPTFAPRFKLSEIKGHSLMIHAFGDNYQNQPENGGGGPRIACGVIQG